MRGRSSGRPFLLVGRGGGEGGMVVGGVSGAEGGGWRRGLPREAFV